MSNAVITITVEPEIKKKAQEFAKQEGLSLGELINKYLHKFVKTKTKRYEDEVPNAYFRRMRKKALKDREEGKASPIFTSNKKLIKQDPTHYIDIDLMDEWLKQQLEI